MTIPPTELTLTGNGRKKRTESASNKHRTHSNLTMCILMKTLVFQSNGE